MEEEDGVGCSGGRGGSEYGGGVNGESGAGVNGGGKGKSIGFMVKARTVPSAKQPETRG